MPKFVPIPGESDQDLRRHQLVELGLEIDALVHELPEDRVVEDPPDRRRPLEQQLEFRVQPVQPGGRIPCSVDGTTCPGASTIVAASCSA